MIATIASKAPGKRSTPFTKIATPPIAFRTLCFISRPRQRWASSHSLYVNSVSVTGKGIQILRVSGEDGPTWLGDGNNNGIHR